MKHKMVFAAVFFVITGFGLKAEVLPVGDSDTLSANIIKLPAEKQRTIIQGMNKRQLIQLVDYLFALEKVPNDLLNEIDHAVANLKEDEKGESADDAVVSTNTFPAADYYVSWEIDKLFPPEDLLNLEGDTSITLDLIANSPRGYCHPYDGVITSMFGWRDKREHKGVDIDLEKGDQVGAAFDGMVRVARMYGGFGNVVIIRHYNGLETVYAHLSKIKVESGQKISAGDIIGLGGNTGHSRGSHLHFEVRFKGVPINPKYLISLSEQKLMCDELCLKQTKWGVAAYPKDAKVYTVEKGDTLWSIAKQFGTTTTTIKKLNGDCTRVHAGQVINVAQ